MEVYWRLEDLLLPFRVLPNKKFYYSIGLKMLNYELNYRSYPLEPITNYNPKLSFSVFVMGFKTANCGFKKKKKKKTQAELENLRNFPAKFCQN